MAMVSLAVPLGLLTWSALLLAVAATLVALGVADRSFARRTLRDVRIHLQPPAETTADVPVPVLVTVTGVVRPVVVRVPGPGTAAQFVVDSDAPGWVTLPPAARGVKWFVTVDLLASGPLGLYDGARRARLRLAVPVVVGPPPVAHPLDWPDTRAMSMARAPTAPVGEELVRGLRTYRRGDSPRRVHWKATARFGQLMVTESDGLGVAVLRIVVAVRYPSIDAEWAMQRAAWVAARARSRGWSVLLVTNQPTGALPPPPPLGPPATLGAHLAASTAFEPHDHQWRRPSVVSEDPVRDERDVRRLLATATFGPIPELRDGIRTRVVSEGVDEWR